MAIMLRVFSPGSEPLDVPIPAEARGFTAVDAMEAIEAHNGGVNIGFNVSTWLLFQASTASGKKLGESLAFDHYFNNASGDIVHVWVEPSTSATDGELWGSDC